MPGKKSFAAVSAGLVVVAMILSGCGGAKMLKEPIAQPADPTLTSAQDDRLRVELEWVIVRDGPGAWSSSADWDEYVLVITNKTAKPLVIDEISLVDSLGGSAVPGITREKLVRASRKTAKRYKKADVEIKAGMTGIGLLSTASAMMVGGTYVALQTAASSIAGTAAGSALGWAGVAAVYAAPVVVVGGVVRGVNNTRVDIEIRARQTKIPYDLETGGENTVSVFYPVSPSPERIEIKYRDAAGAHTLLLDTRKVLEGLHLEPLPEPGVAVAST